MCVDGIYFARSLDLDGLKLTSNSPNDSVRRDIKGC